MRMPREGRWSPMCHNVMVDRRGAGDEPWEADPGQSLGATSADSGPILPPPPPGRPLNRRSPQLSPQTTPNPSAPAIVGLPHLHDVQREEVVQEAEDVLAGEGAKHRLPSFEGDCRRAAPLGASGALKCAPRHGPLARRARDNRLSRGGEGEGRLAAPLPDCGNAPSWVAAPTSPQAGAASPPPPPRGLHVADARGLLEGPPKSRRCPQRCAALATMRDPRRATADSPTGVPRDLRRPTACIRSHSLAFPTPWTQQTTAPIHPPSLRRVLVIWPPPRHGPWPMIW